MSTAAGCIMSRELLAYISMKLSMHEVRGYGVSLPVLGQAVVVPRELGQLTPPVMSVPLTELHARRTRDYHPC